MSATASSRLDRVPAVWLVLGSIVSIQFGASVGKSLFPAIGPFGAALLRLGFAGLLLLTIARPRLRGRTVREWGLVTAFTATLVVMNLTIYLAFTRVPIGVAVTLEFLGPLGVAVAGSHRWLDALWVLFAGTGVALLGLAHGVSGATDLLGIGLALVAGGCWAAYIVVGERMGRTWNHAEALAIACAVGGIALAGPGLATNPITAWTPRIVLLGAAVAVLSSVIPYVMELAALQRIPKPVFGILMSLEPAVAALMAWLVLHEALTLRQWAAMACVVAASMGATLTARRRARTPQPPAVARSR